MARGRVVRWLVAGLAVGLIGALIPVFTLGGTSDAVPSAVIDQTGGWPDAPYNSQYGTVNIPYSCTVKSVGLPVLHVDLAVKLTALFPLAAASNQDFYITDGRGTAVFPAKSVNLLRQLGIREFSGKTTEFMMTAAGATPSVINTAKTRDIEFPRSTLEKDQPLTMTLPTGEPLRIGPYHAASGSVDMGLGDMKASLKAYGMAGIRLPVDASLDCPAPKPIRLVAIIPIGGKADPVGVDIPGHIEEANIPVQGGLLGAVIPVPCNFPGYGTYPVAQNVNAYVKKLFAYSGEKWSFDSGHGYVSLPKELVDAFFAKHPDVASSDVSLSELQTISENSFPEKQNYLKGVTAGDTLYFTKGKASFGLFPAKGEMLAPEVSTAGKVGTMHVYLGEVKGTAQLRDKDGKAIGDPIPFDCPTMTNPRVPLLPYVVAPR